MLQAWVEAHIHIIDKSKEGSLCFGRCVQALHNNTIRAQIYREFNIIPFVSQY
jgi:hypothetical protein